MMSQGNTQGRLTEMLGRSRVRSFGYPRTTGPSAAASHRALPRSADKEGPTLRPDRNKEHTEDTQTHKYIQVEGQGERD